jgi:hypothetical protein
LFEINAGDQSRCVVYKVVSENILGDIDGVDPSSDVPDREKFVNLARAWTGRSLFEFNYAQFRTSFFCYSLVIHICSNYTGYLL